MMDKLQKLISLCKCGVYVRVNQHRDLYEPIADYLAENIDEDLTDEVRQKIIETDTIVEVQFYPNTPIGFNTAVHYDLDAALDEALRWFDEEK